MNDFPKRTDLYNVAPLNASTPLIESLMSYIGRTAIMHNLSYYDLLMKVVYPVYYDNINSIDFKEFRSYLADINSGIISQDLIKVLNDLTGNTNLLSTTAFGYNRLFYIRSQKHIKWCNSCLRKQKETGIFYEPFIWSFSNYKVCVLHKELLQFICPHCENVLSRRSLKHYPGFCH